MASVKLVIAAEADTEFASPVFESDASAPQTTGSYHPIKHAASGLDPDTAYRGRFEVFDQPKGDVFHFRTAPAPGTPKAFKVLFGSCARLIAGTTVDVEALEAMAEEDFDLFVDLGDTGYDDISSTNIDIRRAKFTRNWRGIEAVRRLLLKAPTAKTISDHDGPGDDKHADSPNFAALMAGVRQVYRETVPHYPFLDPHPTDPILTQAWDWGAIRFVMPDCHSQRRFQVGTPTMLGRTSGHEQWNQFQGTIDDIAAAKAAGQRGICIPMSAGWSGVKYGAWGQYWAEERAQWCDAMAAIIGIPPVYMGVGDMHFLAIGDASCTNYGEADLRIMQFVSSAMKSNPINYGGPFTWLNTPANFYSPTRTKNYAISAWSADNRSAVITLKNVETGTPVVLGEYDTADLPGWIV